MASIFSTAVRSENPITAAPSISSTNLMMSSSANANANTIRMAIENECNQDEDCENDEQWCAPHSNGYNFCKDYATLDEPCNFFTIPENIERCNPTTHYCHEPLWCRIPDIGGTCGDQSQLLQEGDCCHSDDECDSGICSSTTRLCLAATMKGPPIQPTIAPSMSISSLEENTDECNQDEDCENDEQWCAPHSNGKKFCKDYASLGDRCDARTIFPEDIGRCNSVTQYCYKPLWCRIPDIGGTCVDQSQLLQEGDCCHSGDECSSGVCSSGGICTAPALDKMNSFPSMNPSMPPTLLGSNQPSLILSTEPTVIVSTNPTIIASPSPFSMMVTENPTISNCENWCPTHPVPWKHPDPGVRQKCNFKKRCAGCPQCQIGFESQSPTPGPTKGCQIWCSSHNSPWEEKCGWSLNCGGCSACDITDNPSSSPTTSFPTSFPSTLSSISPTTHPSVSSSTVPSSDPTEGPTLNPTTAIPTSVPSSIPTQNPSDSPTQTLSSTPTHNPTLIHSQVPTDIIPEIKDTTMGPTGMSTTVDEPSFIITNATFFVNLQAVGIMNDETVKIFEKTMEEFLSTLSIGTDEDTSVTILEVNVISQFETFSDSTKGLQLLSEENAVSATVSLMITNREVSFSIDSLISGGNRHRHHQRHRGLQVNDDDLNAFLLVKVIIRGIVIPLTDTPVPFSFEDEVLDNMQQNLPTYASKLASTSPFFSAVYDGFVNQDIVTNRPDSTITTIQSTPLVTAAITMGALVGSLLVIVFGFVVYHVYGNSSKKASRDNNQQAGEAQRQNMSPPHQFMFNDPRVMTVQYPRDINVLRQDSFSTITYNGFSTNTGSLKHIDSHNPSEIEKNIAEVLHDSPLNKSKSDNMIIEKRRLSQNNQRETGSLNFRLDYTPESTPEEEFSGSVKLGMKSQDNDTPDTISISASQSDTDGKRCIVVSAPSSSGALGIKWKPTIDGPTVYEINPQSPFLGLIEDGDILISIDGVPIDNEGTNLPSLPQAQNMVRTVKVFGHRSGMKSTKILMSV